MYGCTYAKIGMCECVFVVILIYDLKECLCVCFSLHFTSIQFNSIQYNFSFKLISMI